jgi:Flp pilus assembly pilin Flp
MRSLILAFSHRIRGFHAHRGGATAIEYALLAAGIGIALISVFFLTGQSIADYWGTFVGRLNDHP